MRYLITGGCGFIGSHLVEYLTTLGHELIILDSMQNAVLNPKQCPSVEVITGDICDESLVADAMQTVDGCFHLAAVPSVTQSNEQWLATHKINLTATINIFQQAKNVAMQRGDQRAMPVIYASSAAVYGDCSDLPLAESSVSSPLSAYGADKLACELHAGVAQHIHHVPSVGFRFFNVYGPRQNPNSPYSGVISKFFSQLLASQPLSIFGDGKQTRDFVYVKDVVVILYEAMSKPIPNCHQVINICSGKATSLLDLVEVIGSIAEETINVEFLDARPGDIKHSVGDPSKLLASYTPRARADLQQGLGELYKYYKEQYHSDAKIKQQNQQEDGA